MISEILAQFISSCHYNGLPVPVKEMARRCVLDWMGSAIRGSVEPPARMYADLAREEGGEGRTFSLSGKFRTSVTWAAQINAAASHTVEMDDLHPGSVLHAAAPIVAAALAVGEAADAGGEELIAAIVAGYEVAIRAGEAAGRSHYDFWHTTATCGTFGVAAAAAKLLTLSTEQIVHALGSAGTQAAGLWQFLDDGAMSKQLHTAHAAATGILAAQLAQRGFTAARQIFEGRKGFLAAMSKDADVKRLTENLGQDYRMLTNSFKRHASCRHTHTAIDAALVLRNERHIAANDLEAIDVYLYPAGFHLLSEVKATSAYAARFSIPYTIAAAVVRGRVGLKEFENIDSVDIRQMMHRVRLVEDVGLGQDYPEKWPARVVVTLKNGESDTAMVEYPKGDSMNPLTLEELREKFRGLTDDIISPVEQERLIGVSEQLERQRVRDIWPPDFAR
jgi:2-methylcitrate dehydratase PrpD